MTQSHAPEGLKLLEQLQQAVEAAQLDAAAREARAETRGGAPTAVEVATRLSALPLLEQVCRVADRLAAKAESELDEIEAALRQWLAAAQACSRHLVETAPKTGATA